MAIPQEIYNHWRADLKSPDDSIFYYHPGLERILLGLSIFVISSRSLFQSLGKAKELTLLHIYTTDLVTAWIDEDDEKFEVMFPLTMTIAEAYMPCIMALEQRNPSKKKNLKALAAFFANAIGCGGDMNPELAETLLYDLSTDGKRLYSEKIEGFGNRLLQLTKHYGADVPVSSINLLNGW